MVLRQKQDYETLWTINCLVNQEHWLHRVSVTQALEAQTKVNVYAGKLLKVTFESELSNACVRHTV